MIKAIFHILSLMLYMLLVLPVYWLNDIFKPAEFIQRLQKRRYGKTLAVILSIPLTMWTVLVENPLSNLIEH